MRVRCIDASQGILEQPYLTLGELYEVESKGHDGRLYLENITRNGDGWSGFNEKRFVIVEPNACPQCGKIHE